MAVTRTGPVQPVHRNGQQDNADQNKRKKKQKREAGKGHTDGSVNLTLSPEALARLRDDQAEGDR